MGRSSRCGRRGVLIGLGVGFGVVACGLDSGVPGRKGGAAPVSSGVTLSGAGVPDSDVAVGFGDDSAITDIGGSGNEASVGEMAGGTDSGGAHDESAGGLGGAASNRGGAAAAGGSAAHSSGGANAGAGGASFPPPSLFFSEYVEGSSSNKALEISAQKRSVLDGCKVGAYFNGKSEAQVVASLTGTLEGGQVLTLCSSTLSTKLGSVCGQVANLTFNGDDALAISCDGKILDVIGQIGVDPGTAWGNATNATADHTLRRKCSVISGDANGLNVFDPSGEWQAFPADTFSGLGSRGC